jgi:1-deoxy-D-xylulose-5-phosphate reductoisomerase
MIHSMVQYVDGSVIAQMGNPDMRTPIAFGLAYPERIASGVAPLDFSQLKDFSFSTPCSKRYPNLNLAIQACRDGQAATTQLNATNEIAVAAFLNQQIQFSDIAEVNQRALNQLEPMPVSSIQHILEIDRLARGVSQQIVKGMQL